MAATVIDIDYAYAGECRVIRQRVEMPRLVACYAISPQ